MTQARCDAVREAYRIVDSSRYSSGGVLTVLPVFHLNLKSSRRLTYPAFDLIDVLIIWLSRNCHVSLRLPSVASSANDTTAVE